MEDTKKKADQNAANADQNAANADQNAADMVEIELFKDNDKYRDDVIVGVNGKMYQIKRGVRVKVPKSVAEVLENAKKQQGEAAEFMYKLEKDFEKKTKEMENM